MERFTIRDVFPDPGPGGGIEDRKPRRTSDRVAVTDVRCDAATIEPRASGPHGEASGAGGALPEVHAGASISDAIPMLHPDSGFRARVVDDAGAVLGVVTRHGILNHLSRRLINEREALAGFLELLTTFGSDTELAVYSLDTLTKLVDAEYAVMGLIDDKGQIGPLIHARAQSALTHVSNTQERDYALLGLVLDEDRLINIAPGATGSVPEACPNACRDISGFLGTPIRHDGRVIGSVVFHKKRNGQAFDSNDERIATVMAGVFAQLSGTRNQGTVQWGVTERQKIISAIEQTADSIMITDREGVIEYVNTAFEQITGFARQEAIGRLPHIIKSDYHDREFFEKLWTTVLSGKVFSDVFINRRKDGSLYHEEKTITPLRDRLGQITHFVATAKDVSERLKYEERLYRLAHHDPLTDLPNRTLFIDRLSRALLRARRTDRLGALMFLDLDRFKFINDSLGHEAGDSLLKSLSSRLAQSVRKGDTVARLGGDEIAIIVEDVSSSGDVVQVTHKIIETFNRPYKVLGRELFVSTSIGIAVYPTDGDDVNTLLKRADMAMYRAKEHGGNSFQFYSEQMSAASEEHLALETSIRRALERNEFQVFYQPKVDLRTGEINSVEALVRWQHPQQGLVPPLKFIPVAEQTGLIAPLGEWIMRTACADTRKWHNLGFALSTAVNLSGRQLRLPTLERTIRGILDDYRMAPANLSIEITESTLIDHSEGTLETLVRLRDLGMSVMIDDFGTGYSSLGYLKRLPIDTLKIDRTFVRDIITDPDDAAIVNAIVTMAHKLDIRAIAEGVESREQLSFLRECDCDMAQGYYLGRPMPFEEMTRHMRLFGIPAR
jgi:diguanylate cyclase (GGDEF)-like protein/PAS domain S-box-containing protein